LTDEPSTQTVAVGTVGVHNVPRVPGFDGVKEKLILPDAVYVVVFKLIPAKRAIGVVVDNALPEHIVFWHEFVVPCLGDITSVDAPLLLI
jgi:hypothetical protein